MAAEMEQVHHPGVFTVLEAGRAFTVLEAGREVAMMKLHEMLGHPNERVLRNTAKYYIWTLLQTGDRLTYPKHISIDQRRKENG